MLPESTFSLKRERREPIPHPAPVPLLLTGLICSASQSSWEGRDGLQGATVAALRFLCGCGRSLGVELLYMAPGWGCSWGRQSGTLKGSPGILILCPGWFCPERRGWVGWDLAGSGVYTCMEVRRTLGVLIDHSHRYSLETRSLNLKLGWQSAWPGIPDVASQATHPRLE